MPGIAGLFDYRSTGRAAENVRRLLDAMAERLDSGSSAVQDCGTAAFAAFTTSGRAASGAIAIDERRNLLVAIDGELLRSGGARPLLPAAETVLDAYRRHGEQFIEHLRGAFSASIWDGDSQTLLLATDRSGLRPLYWRRSETSFAFASNARVLLTLSDSRAIDPHGLCDFVVFGFPLGTRTIFQGIERVPPASVAVIRPDEVRLRQYWRLSYPGSASRRLSTDQAAQAMADGLIAAVDDLAERDAVHGVPLSGGLDSRLILASLLRRGHKVKTFTMGGPDSADLRIAADVARALDVPHEAWRLTPRDFLGWVEDGVFLTDGMCGAFDTHILYLTRRLPSDVGVVFDGTSSLDGMYSHFDVLLYRYLKRHYSDLRQLLWVFTKPLVSENGELASENLLASGFRAHAHHCVRRTLQDLLNSAPPDEVDPFNRTDWFEQTLRVPRFNMMGSVLLRTGREVRHPFFHPQVLDLVRRLPCVFRTKEKPVLRRSLACLCPNLCSLPWERTGLPCTAGNGRVLAAYLNRRLSGMLRRAFPIKSRSQPFRRRIAIDYGLWLAQSPEMQDFVRDTLCSRRFEERGFFEPTVVRRLVDDAFRGASQLPLLGRLISVELAHRMFIDARPRTSGAASL